MHCPLVGDTLGFSGGPTGTANTHAPAGTIGDWRCEENGKSRRRGSASRCRSTRRIEEMASCGVVVASGGTLAQVSSSTRLSPRDAGAVAPRALRGGGVSVRQLASASSFGSHNPSLGTLACPRGCATWSTTSSAAAQSRDLVWAWWCCDHPTLRRVHRSDRALSEDDARRAIHAARKEVPSQSEPAHRAHV